MHLSYGLRRKYEISIPFVIYGEKTCVEYRTFTAESQQTAQECPFNDLFYFIWLTHLEFQYIGILFQSSYKETNVSHNIVLPNKMLCNDRNIITNHSCLGPNFFIIFLHNFPLHN